MRSRSVRAAAVSCARVVTLVVVGVRVSDARTERPTRSVRHDRTSATDRRCRPISPHDSRDRTLPWSNDSTIPGRYRAARRQRGPGPSNAGALYNFGATANRADRAVGFLSSGTGTQSGNLYAKLANNTATALSGLQISYNVEKYRGGTNAAGFRIASFLLPPTAPPGTSAGADFTTAVSRRRRQCRLPPAPGVTGEREQDVERRDPRGRDLLPGWNYSVASGTTTSNAQALGIDDINITGVIDDTPPPDTAPDGHRHVARQRRGERSGRIDDRRQLQRERERGRRRNSRCRAAARRRRSPSRRLRLEQLYAHAGAPLPYEALCTVTVSAGEIADAGHERSAGSDGGGLRVSFTTASAPPPAATNVIVNEVDADTPGTDTAEFVELYDGGAGNTSLDGLVLVFFNGNGGASYAAFDLDGFSTDANGYFVSRESGRARRRSRLQPRRRRTAAERRGRGRRSMPATRRTSRTARPSRPRTCATRSCTTPTTSMSRGCWSC